MTELCIAEDIKTTELAKIDVSNPIALFKPNGCDPIIDAIEKEVDRLLPTLDISTEKGQRAVNSLARKIGSSKVLVDECGKKLTAEQKAFISGIDAERKRMRDKLDGLTKKVKAPLIEWEAKQQARKDAHETALINVRTISLLPGQHPRIVPSEEIRERIEDLKPFRQRDWEEFSTRAGREIGEAEKLLDDELRLAEFREAEELLRHQEQVKADIQRRKDREAQIQREATEKAEREAKRQADELAAKVKADSDAAEAARLKAIADAEAAEKRARDAEERREKERKSQHLDVIKVISNYGRPDGAWQVTDLEFAIKRIAEIYARDWEEFAEDARVAYDSAKECLEANLADLRAFEKQQEEDAKAEAERRTKAAADAAIEAERKRVSAEEKKRADAEAERMANSIHRWMIESEIVEDLAMTFGSIDLDVIREVVNLISQGEIRHVTINY